MKNKLIRVPTTLKHGEFGDFYTDITGELRLFLCRPVTEKLLPRLKKVKDEQKVEFQFSNYARRGAVAVEIKRNSWDEIHAVVEGVQNSLYEVTQEIADEFLTQNVKKATIYVAAVVKKS